MSQARVADVALRTRFVNFEKDSRFEEREEGDGERNLLRARTLQEVVGEVDELVDDRLQGLLDFTNVAA